MIDYWWYYLNNYTVVALVRIGLVPQDLFLKRLESKDL